MVLYQKTLTPTTRNVSVTEEKGSVLSAANNHIMWKKKTQEQLDKNIRKALRILPSRMRKEAPITVNIAAEELGVTPERVRQLINDERLKAVKWGSYYLIWMSDLDAVRDRPKGRPPKKQP